jgi:hypothetical protein
MNRSARTSGKKLFFLVTVTASVLLVLTCGGSMDSRPWLGNSSTIRGTVTAPEGLDPALVAVTLDGSHMVMADDNGRFSFQLVPPGAHRLDARAKAYKFTGQEWLNTRQGEETNVIIALEENALVGTVLAGIEAADMEDLSTVNIQDISGRDQTVILCDNDNGFEVIDISDPGSPLYLGRNSDERNCEALHFEPPYLVTGWNNGAAGTGGIAIYDLSDPSDPGKLGESVTENVVWAIDRADQYVVALGRTHFQVYTISDLNHPSLLASLPLKGEGAQVVGDLVYLATEPELLTVIDISEPAAPEIIWQSSETGFGVDCAVSGESVYIAASGKVYQYDIRRPADPRLVNVIDGAYLQSQGLSLEGPMGLEGLTVEGREVYLGAIFDGLVVVNYDDPFRPHFAWQASTPGVPFAMNVYVAGSHAHVAAWTRGYRIVRRK